MSMGQGYLGLGLRRVFAYFNPAMRVGYEPIIGDITLTHRIMYDEEPFEVFPYRQSKQKKIIFHVLAVLLLGLPHLLLHWFKQLVPKFMFSTCSIEEADVLVLKDLQNKFYIVHIYVAESQFNPADVQYCTQRYFDFRYLRFVWDENIQKFAQLLAFNNDSATLARLLQSPGLSQQQQEDLLLFCGRNKISIDEKSYWKLFMEEVFNPFYVFQIGSMVLWCFDEYYVYAACIFFISGLSILSSLYQTKKQQQALQEMVQASVPTTIEIMRFDGSVCEVNADCLVPGDIVLIPPHGCVLPCDAVLLNGACTVNESMLTGECVSVTKTPPSANDFTLYNTVVHKRHTIYSGTIVIQTRMYSDEQVSAVVVRTGFSTAKGALIRSILFPRDVGFKFYTDSVKFLTALSVVAVLGMTYSVYLYVVRGATIKDIILRALDIVTIAVPPALPAAMTAGTVYSQNRLKKTGIFCISPPRINVCGKVKLACFDKTGTLTENGLVFRCVVGCSPHNFFEEMQDPSNITVGHPVLSCMATCHSLTREEGELIGDPLDMEMFRSTNWIMEEADKGTTRYEFLGPVVVRPAVYPAPPPEEPIRQYSVAELASMKEEVDVDSDSSSCSSSMEDGPHPSEMGIVRQFPFISSEQCMSVITKTAYGPMVVYVKGAPERIHSMCDYRSVPTQYHGKVRLYTSSGYRVIALACKQLEKNLSWHQASKMKRTDVEKDLMFIGLMILQNNLKPESTPVIRELQNSNIRCVMITGDNLLTAVSIARSCEMIPYYKRVIQVSVGTNRNTRVTRLEMQYVEVHENIGQGFVVNSSACATHFMNLDNINFAIEGSSWTLVLAYFPDLVPYLCTHGTVFARMTPDKKTEVIQQFQKCGYVTAMCGDGANDCGALKAAHVGVSLSEAEASIAAPFTSHEANITCVLKLVKEGRCALVTSFALFKYMAMYSLIQFTTVLALYTKYSLLGSMQFLFIDLVITTSLAMVMGRARPAEQLSVKRPMGSLMSVSNLFPLAIQTVIMVIVQIVALYYLTLQSWYVPITPLPNSDMEVCWENTTLFLIGCFQYLILATVHSKGKPYRQPQYKNVLLVITLAILSMCCTLLLVYPPAPLAYLLEIEPLSDSYEELYFRLSLLLLPIFHLLISIAIETFVSEAQWLKGFGHFITRKRKPKNRYKHVDNELIIKVHWLQPCHFRSM